MPYLQACTRLMRADYCGDGHPHTVPGTTVQILERAAPPPPAAHAYGTFEAVWGQDGAICLRRVRLPALFSLEELLRQCPGLAPRVGEQCSEETLWQHPEALLGNRS